MSDPTLTDIQERFVCRDMSGIDGTDVTYLLNKISELEEAVIKFGRSDADFKPYLKRIRELQAKLDAVKALPTYPCHFEDIGKIGPAYRQRDVWAIIEQEKRDEQ